MFFFPTRETSGLDFYRKNHETSSAQIDVGFQSSMDHSADETSISEYIIKGNPYLEIGSSIIQMNITCDYYIGIKSIHSLMNKKIISDFNLERYVKVGDLRIG